MPRTDEAVRAHLVGFHGIVQSDDYWLWAKDKPPEFNVMAYFGMVRERQHATRLEF